MAKRTFTDESLATLVDETKLYVDSKSYHKNKSILDNTTASYTTAEKTKLSGIATGAEVNQNAFSNVKVGSTTVVADSKTDTIEFVGSNVTITPDATNDKITFAVANGSTSKKGIVQLTDSTSSTSTTTAATPKNVKAAYDLANTAKTNAATVQSKLDAHIAGYSDVTNTELASEIEGEAPTIDPAITNLIDSLTAEDVGALPIEGGTVSGDIVVTAEKTASFRAVSNKYNRRSTFQNDGNSTYVLNGSLDSSDYSGFTIDSQASLVNKFLVCDKPNGGSIEYYKLFGEHNKPYGSYTGNGSVTARQIFHSGMLKRMIIITGNDWITFVPYEACSVSINCTSGQIVSHGWNVTAGSGRDISIKTDSPSVNANGVTYRYWLL